MIRSCPRAGCGNTLHSDDQIVCAGDFHLLASMCRGKRRLGEPAAAAVQSERRMPAYFCELCRSFHNGGAVGNRLMMQQTGQATVQALRADPRAGWRGVLALADAWAPAMSERERWSEGLDQRIALTAT